MSKKKGKGTKMLTKVVFLFILMASVPAFAQASGSNATTVPNIATVTPTPVRATPAPTEAPAELSSNPAIIAVGVVLLLILAGISFYLVIVWPKQSLMNYRKDFEDVIITDGEAMGADGGKIDKTRDVVVAQDGEVRLLSKKSLYGGAPVAVQKEGIRKIPTFKEIEDAKKVPETKSVDAGRSMSFSVQSSPPASPMWSNKQGAAASPNTAANAMMNLL